jgi:hypothetical protein
MDEDFLGLCKNVNNFSLNPFFASYRINNMSPKIIGIIFGTAAAGIFAWKFRDTPLCRP